MLRARFVLLLLFFYFSLSAMAQAASSTSFQLYSSDGNSQVLGGNLYVVKPQQHLHRLVWLWGNLEVQGSVEELFVFSGHVKVLPGAEVSHSFTVVMGSFELYEGAKVDPSIIKWKQQTLTWQSVGFLVKTVGQWGIATSLQFVFLFVFTIFLWGLGALFLGGFPSLRERFELNLASPLNLAWAVMGVVLVFGVTLLLILSVLGILLLPFWLFFLGFICLLTQIAGMSWLGHRLSFWRKSIKFSAVSLLLGVVCLLLIWAVKGAITLWILFITSSLSWGSLIRSLFAHRAKGKV